MRPWEEFLPADVVGTVTGTDFAVRRPKPLIPLNTALDNVNNSSNTSLSLIPVVLMLTRIASARIGERITSITTDARFLVVFGFIRFVCSTVDASQCCSRRASHLQPVCHWTSNEFVGVLVLVCSLWLTTSSGPTGVSEGKSVFY